MNGVFVNKDVINLVSILMLYDSEEKLFRRSQEKFMGRQLIAASLIFHRGENNGINAYDYIHICRKLFKSL